MCATAHELIDKARELVAANPLLSPQRAYQIVLERDPKLAARHHAGDDGSVPEEPQPPATADPGVMLQQYAATMGVSFREACEEFPILFDSWRRAEYVAVGSTRAVPPTPRETIMVYRAALPADGIMRDVEVMAVGIWNGRKFTTADLDAMVSAFDRVGFRPPVKLGHGDDNELAHGFVSSLRRVGTKLVADFLSVPAETIANIKARRLLTVSVEVYFDLPRNGQRFPIALKAVALLGTNPPAVSDLRPLAEALREAV